MTAIPAMELPGGGRPMPVVGFGTASFPRALPEAVREAILHAIALGYRHFDTATLYGTERSLGDAISDGLRRGLISSRDELFVTSKLWCTDNYADKVLPALQESLRNLQMEYLDLFLVHWPVSLHPIEGSTQPFDYGGVWGAMQECQRLGLAKSIGVSNFSCKKLEEILSLAKIPPAVNQVEMHPEWQQKKLMDFCKEKGILVTAYSPLGGNGILWGTKDVRECNTLKEIAAATEKTIAQVCLKWLFEQGIPFVVKSYNPERMKENLDIFDWELRTEDLQKISELPQNRGNERVGFVSPTGPYKTLEELWDGEV